MRGFFVFSAIYFGIAVVLVEIFRGDGVLSALGAVESAVRAIPHARLIIALLVLAALASVLLADRLGYWRERAGRAGYALMGTICFLSAFGLCKNLLPDIHPFHADPPLARFDAWLHGGVDPWRVMHAWAAHFPMRWLEPLYLQVWATLALTFPLMLAVADADGTRVRRFLILYAIAWIGLGNVAALAGLSAGPVYYDRLTGSDRFADLTAAIEGGVFASPLFRIVQDALWNFYAEGRQVLGTGISAFPSVHVAVACVIMLYVVERVPLLVPVAVAYLAAIQFLSVYTGYHYAVDGYASILALVSAWVWLRRARRVRNAPDAVAVPAE